MSFLDQDYREIITKAVIGKGRKFTQDSHIISPTHQPSSILGCWIINHLYNAKRRGDEIVEVSGSYDINVWYSYNDHTKTEVVTERVTYTDPIKLSVKDKQTVGSQIEVYAKALQQPNSINCSIEKSDRKIKTEVEREFLVEVIGDTKVAVRVDPSGVVESDDDWLDQLSDEELINLEPKSDK
ncbi:outer spore coat protein CotE [Amphibacillus sediminis]|uniref:outer spore coat protein CotE n=1 Tax=Amphibacillus sediminis TaxID=360185 RepID=UPI0008348530|nr:outer spore coat protein CotE [Amphibacillus sediminis]